MSRPACIMMGQDRSEKMRQGGGSEPQDTALASDAIWAV